MSEGKTTMHFQAKLNPYDNMAVYEWVEAALRRHALASSPPKSVLCELVEAKLKADASERSNTIEGMLQQILDAVQNGVPKGKARKEAVTAVTNEMNGFLARLRNVAQSEESE